MRDIDQCETVADIFVAKRFFHESTAQRIKMSVEIVFKFFSKLTEYIRIWLSCLIKKAQPTLEKEQAKSSVT